MTESERFAAFPEIPDPVYDDRQTELRRRFFAAAVKAREGRPARLGGWPV